MSGMEHRGMQTWLTPVGLVSYMMKYNIFNWCNVLSMLLILEYEFSGADSEIIPVSTWTGASSGSR